MEKNSIETKEEIFEEIDIKIPSLIIFDYVRPCDFKYVFSLHELIEYISKRLIEPIYTIDQQFTTILKDIQLALYNLKLHTYKHVNDKLVEFIDYIEIDFNPKSRCLDILYDLEFMMMCFKYIYNHDSMESILKLMFNFDYDKHVFGVYFYIVKQEIKEFIEESKERNIELRKKVRGVSYLFTHDYIDELTADVSYLLINIIHLYKSRNVNYKKWMRFINDFNLTKNMGNKTIEFSSQKMKEFLQTKTEEINAYLRVSDSAFNVVRNAFKLEEDIFVTESNTRDIIFKQRHHSQNFFPNLNSELSKNLTTILPFENQQAADKNGTKTSYEKETSCKTSPRSKIENEEDEEDEKSVETEIYEEEDEK